MTDDADANTRGNDDPARPDVLGFSYERFTDYMTLAVGSLMGYSLVWTAVYLIGGYGEARTFAAVLVVYAMLVSAGGEYLRRQAERGGE